MIPRLLTAQIAAAKTPLKKNNGANADLNGKSKGYRISARTDQAF
jgi:hypothetical protein